MTNHMICLQIPCRHDTSCVSRIFWSEKLAVGCKIRLFPSFNFWSIELIFSRRLYEAYGTTEFCLSPQSVIRLFGRLMKLWDENEFDMKWFNLVEIVYGCGYLQKK